MLVSTAQTKKVTGKIFNEQSLPLSGATIQLKKSNKKVVADANGNFSIEVPVAGQVALSISFVGYSEQTISIKNNEPLIVLLEFLTSTIADVVVVGYGTSK